MSDWWGKYASYNEFSKPGRHIQRLLYDRSDGRIQLNIVPKMFPPAEALGPVAEGEADITDLGTNYYHGTYPIFGWANLPFIYRADFLEGIILLRDIVEEPDLQKIYDEEVWSKVGLVALGPMPWGFGNLIFSNQKITKLEDFQGYKVRTYGAYMAEGYKLLGATPLTLAFGEVSSSLVTGVIDGFASSMASGILIFGADKIAKYLNRVPVVAAWEGHFVMNREKFESLPPDLQQVVKDVFFEAGMMGNFGAFAEKLLAQKIAVDAGMELVELEPAEVEKAMQILAPLREKYLEDAGPRGAEVLAIVERELKKFESFKPLP
jgi:TRAP-type C4-dicarboxylate transport system substrate-binding protein